MIVFLLNYHYLVRLDKIRITERSLSNLELETLRVIKLDNDFLDIESTNKQYFISRKSWYLTKRDSLMQKLFEQISIQQHNTDVEISLQKGLGLIAINMTTYNHKFWELEDKMFICGFLDYGLEGKMRKYAHALEEQPEIALSDVLSLRRHEKDFFLRHDSIYVEQFNDLAALTITKLERKNSAMAVEILHGYEHTFNELVSMQKSIGLSSNEGLRDELNKLTNRLSADFLNLSSAISTQSEYLLGRVFLIFFLSALLSFILSILLSYYLSTKLSRPIKKLANIMDLSLKRDAKLKYTTDLGFNKPAREIVNLSKSFFTLMDQRENQLNEIELKSAQMSLKNEELEKLNDELDKFIYSTAHDLRSPLASVMGLIQLLEYDKSDKNIKHYSALMRSSISRMERFIKDVVNYSKNKKLGLEYEAVSIKLLINDVFEEHRFIPQFENIDIVVQVNGAEVVYSDYNRLKIIFNNLISNAIRYSDKRKENPFIIVHIDIQETSFMISFKDNGLGISEEHLQKIFNMFYRATEKSEGSGLGLFILKETIERLEGAINVESEFGVGTLFSITLPNHITPVTPAEEMELAHATVTSTQIN